MKTIYILLLLCFSGALLAQSTYSDLNMAAEEMDLKRTQIFMKGMMLQPDEFDIFLNIFNEYEEQKLETFENSIKNIAAVYNNFDNMTNEEAEVILERIMKNQKSDLKLLDTYQKKIAKELSPLSAFRFVQIELQIKAVRDLQVLEIPIVDD